MRLQSVTSPKSKTLAVPRGRRGRSAKEPATADPLVKFLAEHTDLSPNQAEDLVDREGRNLNKLRKIARTMKAEG